MGRSAAVAGLVFAAYAALAVLLTWPLALGLSRDLPSDLGDPVLNVFILDWDLHALDQGAPFVPSAWQRLWQLPIFHPETQTLAYSEHLFGQALVAWPAHALGAGPVLVYNLLFLSSFALSALGAFLLVREWTGSAGAASLAGLFFGFAPYRFAQLPHLQVLTSWALPFVLLGLTRYAKSGARAPLFLGALALWLQNLSNGYYLLFFAPLAALYALFALGLHGRWRSRRAWLELALAGTLVASATWPFVLPYLEVRERGVIHRERSEVVKLSPDLMGYLTAPAPLRLWGRSLRWAPRPEGELFPGLVPLALGVAGVVAAWRQRTDAGGRARLFAFLGSLPGFATLALLACVWLSLGPVPSVFGRPLPLFSPFALLFDHVPGYDGLRVPGRLALLVALWLAVLAGLGAARLFAARRPQNASALGALLAVVFVVEVWAPPLTLDEPLPAATLAPLPADLPLGDDAPPIYADVARLPAQAVLAELPFGADAYELRYMAAAMAHRRRLANGFSGGLSASQAERRKALWQPLADPARAWRALRSAQVTHVIVHSGAWGRAHYGERLVAWLEDGGARVLSSRAGDTLLVLGSE